MSWDVMLLIAIQSIVTTGKDLSLQIDKKYEGKMCQV
jgi:hypothetical protein